jgi:hypothetical protein
MDEGIKCVACGRTPAIKVSIRRHVGMLVMQRFIKLHKPLCRECGTKFVKQFTLQTLWQGWWGLISFFVNWFVLAANLAAWLKLRRLEAPAPMAAAETADVDLKTLPAPSGAPVSGPTG